MNFLNLFSSSGCGILRFTCGRSYPFQSNPVRNIHGNNRPAYYYHRIGSSPLLYHNLGQHLEIASEKYGNREALVSSKENVRLTYADVKEKVDKIAVNLLESGLKRGDHVAIWAPNTTSWYLSFLAAGRAGFTLACINPALQENEISYSLKKAKVKAIITQETYKDQRFFDILNKVFSKETFVDEPKIFIDSLNELSGAHSFNELLQNVNPDSLQSLESNLNLVQSDHPCNIQFTSGTTGQPKAAVLSHYNVINSSQVFGQRIGLDRKYHRVCCQVPFFHVFGLVTLISALSYGSTIVIPNPSFNPEETIKTIVAEQCSVVQGTPTMYVDLLSAKRRLGLPTDTLEIGIVGGASCSPQLMSDSKEQLELKEMKVAYGLSEGTAAVFQHFGHESDEETFNTVGTLYDHCEAKVIDQNDNVVPFGQPGELCIRGFCTMLDYFEDEEKTKQILGRDKWLKTGDKFILNEDGTGKIVGRIKDIIVRGGENIFPKEIEDFLDTYTDILESQVIGVPDERMGEEICAFLRIRSNCDFSETNLRKFCKGQIAPFKIPRYIRLVDSYPKTTSGKIQKFKLKEIFKLEQENSL